jgi:hypothetical protein
MLSREENSRARTRIFRTNKYSLDKISPRRRTLSVGFPWPASSPNSDAPRLTVRASGGAAAAWEKSSFGFHYFARAITRRRSRLVKMSPGTFAINIPGRNAESPMSLGQFNFVPPMRPAPPPHPPTHPPAPSPFLARFIKRPDRERAATRGSAPRSPDNTYSDVCMYVCIHFDRCLFMFNSRDRDKLRSAIDVHFRLPGSGQTRTGLTLSHQIGNLISSFMCLHRRSTSAISIAHVEGTRIRHVSPSELLRTFPARVSHLRL